MTTRRFWYIHDGMTDSDDTNIPSDYWIDFCPNIDIEPSDINRKSDFLIIRIIDIIIEKISKIFDFFIGKLCNLATKLEMKLIVKKGRKKGCKKKK